MVRLTGKYRCTALRFLTGMIFLAALGNGLVWGQLPTASIIGTAKDSTGAVLPETAITVRHIETGLMRTMQTDSSGNYSIPSLPVGEYEVTGERMGFRREVRRGIDLVVAQEAVVDLTLQVGNLEQQVTVTEDAPLVNTTLASTSGFISEAQVKDLPLNGRSFDQLITLNVATSNNSSNTLNNSSWNGFSVAGKRPETNRFLLLSLIHI